MAAHIYTIASTKGGVGKTYTCLNLSAVMADAGLRVLLIDADDNQAALSKSYPITKRSDHTSPLFKILTGGYIDETHVSFTNIPNLDIILGNLQKRDEKDLEKDDVQAYLTTRLDRGWRLKRILHSQFVNENYDVVIIDTLGAQSALQEACLLAANEIIVPITPDLITVREFKDAMLDVMERLHQNHEPPGPVRIFVSRMDKLKDSKEMANLIRQEFKKSNKISVMNTVVPASKAYKEAHTLSIPAHRHQARTTAQTPSAYETMHRLFWELMPNFVNTYATWEGSPELFPINLAVVPDVELDMKQGEM